MSALTFTLIQTALHWEDKAANLHMLEEKINRIMEPTHIVVLPEMFTTGFSMKPELHAEPMEGPSVAWMKRVAAEKKVILTGSLMIEEDGAYFNRLIWMLPNGQMGWYDKRHLFAMGEEDAHYSAGTKRFITSVNGWRIMPLVCYDLRFPVWARQQFHKAEGFEYDVLLYVANWPDRRAHAWKTLLQARAIENQCYAIGVNRVGNDGHNVYHSGDSMVCNALGEVLYHKAHDEDVVTISLQKNDLQAVREKLPFWKDADPFLLVSQDVPAHQL